MANKQNYQNHIESAIQNVLSKVKNPQTRASAAAAKKTEQPSTTLRTKKPILPKKPTQTGTLTRKPIVPKAQVGTATAAPLDASAPRATAPLNEEEVHYLEAEDLYTPVPLTAEEEPEPVDQDIYHPPYNLFEEFVETEMDILLARYLDLCQCGQCRADMVALALHQLPAYYVTGTRGTLTAKSVVWTRYMQEIMDAVSKAIHVVYKRPRSSCRQIKQVLWIKPELEEVGVDTENTPQYFGVLHDDKELELNFSDEINEIIQALEQAPDADKSALLPVYSAHVENAYQRYEPEAAAPEVKQLLATEELLADEPEAMQLLELDDWDV